MPICIYNEDELEIVSRGTICKSLVLKLQSLLSQYYLIQVTNEDAKSEGHEGTMSEFAWAG